MVRHLVMWRLKDHAHGNDKAVNARLFREKLEALAGRIPGLLRIEVGIDFSCTAASFDVVLYSEFTDRKALAGYQIHPLHEEVKTFIIEASEDRVVVDYED
ncbi:MAG: Dabb family protein [Chlorobium sp.]|uniref:Dabb family protein n=1 Tax=Chlorobium sp. TaxID=1095 RepID=UPI0025C69025|nr:Dabb family protein [Chlorobium sp.]MCF8382353.1 Dabb family protein [Chlorobium sp.]